MLHILPLKCSKTGRNASFIELAKKLKLLYKSLNYFTELFFQISIVTRFPRKTLISTSIYKDNVNTYTDVNL